MSLNTVIILNAICDLGVALVVGATMLVPFTLDRAEEHASAFPLPEELAA